jgi:hypothetical protein
MVFYNGVQGRSFDCRTDKRKTSQPEQRTSIVYRCMNCQGSLGLVLRITRPWDAFPVQNQGYPQKPEDLWRWLVKRKSSVED